MLDLNEVFNRIVAGQMEFDEFEDWVSEQRCDASDYSLMLASEHNCCCE